MAKSRFIKNDQQNCLLFLWIEDFRDIIKKQGFNFTSEFRIDYNDITKKLTIIRNPEYISHFYGDEIIHLKALIGENGSGKSSVLDFIKRNLANFVHGTGTDYGDGNFIAVLKNVIYHYQDIEIANQRELENDGYEFVIRYENENWRYALEAGLGNVRYIFYTNIFDYQDDNSESDNLVSVSTNYLLTSESYNYNSRLSEFANFIYNEFDRQMNFISFFEEGNTVPFNLPDAITVRVDDKVFKYKHEIKAKDISNNLNQLVENAKFSSSDINFEKIRYKIFLNLLILLDYKLKINISTIKSNDLLRYYDSKFDLNILALDTSTKKIFFKIKKLFAALDKLKEFLKTEENYKEYKFSFLFNKLSKSFFYEFIKIQSDLTRLDNFLKYSWRNMSSGEKAFLSIFSRLYYANKQLFERYEESEEDYRISNIVLMIDEPDIYLHPQWQKQFISILIDLLPKIWKGYKMQVILTSHSPILTSDIPKRDIIFIKKNRDTQKCQVIDSTDRQETFASNIHTLFNDSFFIEDGLMGDFAKNKINEIIMNMDKYKKFLSDKTGTIPRLVDESDITKIKETIKIIGEPILKHKLIEYFEECTKNPFNEHINDRIKRLTKELKNAQETQIKSLQK